MQFSNTSKNINTLTCMQPRMLHYLKLSQNWQVSSVLVHQFTALPICNFCVNFCVNFCRSACGSNQPDALSIEYPLPSSSEPDHAPSQSLGKRNETKRKREAKAGAKEKPKAKKTKGATAKKNQQANVPQPSPQSPAMCTRSKAPQSPAMSTRSKRKILSWWPNSVECLFCYFCAMRNLIRLM